MKIELGTTFNSDSNAVMDPNVFLLSCHHAFPPLTTSPSFHTSNRFRRPPSVSLVLPRVLHNYQQADFLRASMVPELLRCTVNFPLNSGQLMPSTSSTGALVGDLWIRGRGRSRRVIHWWIRVVCVARCVSDGPGLKT